MDCILVTIFSNMYIAQIRVDLTSVIIAHLSKLVLEAHSCFSFVENSLEDTSFSLENFV